MVIKSLFREVPELAPTNITELCLHRRPADEPDYTFQIDATTGFKRSWREFKARVGDAMTALAAPESLGGLGLQLENKEIVGVLSPNALVGVSLQRVERSADVNWDVLGLCYDNVCLVGTHDPYLPTLILLNSRRASTSASRLDRLSALRAS
jgi:hypothetical protein